MLHDARDEVMSNRGQAILRAGRVKHVLAGLVEQRRVQVIPRGLIVIGRHAHERRDEAIHVGHLLDQRLEQEGAVRGFDCLAVRQIDLVLRVSVLLRHRDRLQLKCVTGVEHGAHNSRRIGQRTDRVDARVAHRQWSQTTHRLRVTLEEVELEFVRDDGSEAEFRVAGTNTLQRAA